MSSEEMPSSAIHSEHSGHSSHIASLRVADVIGDRTEIFALRPGDSVEEAAQKLVRWRVRTAAVCDDYGNVAGIFGQSDIASRVVAAGRDPRTTRVREVMTSEPVSADIDTDILTCVRIMRKHGISHILLTRTTAEGEQYFGLLSANDVLGVLARQEASAAPWVREFAGS